MATVVLTKLYLHTAADLSQFVAVSLDAFVVKQLGGATVQTYANGRRRLVATPGYNETAQLTLELVDAATVTTLERWAQTATFLMLRDPRGRVMWGFLNTDFQVTEQIGSQLRAQVMVTFMVVSFDESV